MVDGIGDPGLTEFVQVPCLMATGGFAEVSEHMVRVLLWAQLPAAGGETEERRIIQRFAMPIDAAAEFFEQTARKLRRGRH